MRIDSFRAPLMVSWHLTQDCDLACLHCCQDCSPGSRLPDELSRDEALRLAGQIAAAEVPSVLLAGGEPALVPHFIEVAEALGRAGVSLKLETNGQGLGPAAIARLARLPVRSVQVSLDGATQASYGRMRPGASLAKALQTCRALREAGLPLEAAFAPTRLNLHEAAAVMDLAADLGAFRFCTGALMRLGRAARLWETLAPSSQEHAEYLKLLEARAVALAGRMELCFRPFTLREGLEAWLAEPSGTLIVRPDGKVQVAAAFPAACADLRRESLAQAWDSYRAACRSAAVVGGLEALISQDLPVAA